ncbi:hypothetical protein QBC35DRAFT_479144 [Podospora australis]|uniref:Uncharacterized protein n=1 Tax=Podospora australis TaxID=1536484 RepID=A0AAN6WI70_9PEZI|nr:hypothetical protein QBC35DRAFT_479144 [Podospora australis]
MSVLIETSAGDIVIDLLGIALTIRNQIHGETGRVVMTITESAPLRTGGGRRRTIGAQGEILTGPETLGEEVETETETTRTGPVGQIDGTKIVTGGEEGVGTAETKIGTGRGRGTGIEDGASTAAVEQRGGASLSVQVCTSSPTATDVTLWYFPVSARASRQFRKEASTRRIMIMVKKTTYKARTNALCFQFTSALTIVHSSWSSTGHLRVGRKI